MKALNSTFEERETFLGSFSKLNVNTQLGKLCMHSKRRHFVSHIMSSYRNLNYLNYLFPSESENANSKDIQDTSFLRLFQNKRQ